MAPRIDAVALTLAGAERRLLGRIQQLERRLEETAEAELWTSWIEAIVALAQLARDRAASKRQGESLMTTAELAQRLNVSSKTVLRARKAGAFTPVLARGRVIRWAADSVLGGTALGTARTTAANDAPRSSLSRAVRGQRRQ
jgi:hypothetical protein